MDAEASLLLVLALSVLPVGVVPLGILLHDLAALALSVAELVLEAMALGLIVDGVCTYLCARCGDGQQATEAE